MTDELPRPGYPAVVEIEPKVNRWIFTTDDREIQEQEFDFWLGYFSHDERDRPLQVDGRVWLVPITG